MRIAPSNRMPAIVDPDGPGGEPISIFGSGAILQYLGRKFGQLYPEDERKRVEVERWLFWQMAASGRGPVRGTAFGSMRPRGCPAPSIATPTR